MNIAIDVILSSMPPDDSMLRVGACPKPSGTHENDMLFPDVRSSLTAQPDRKTETVNKVICFNVLFMIPPPL